MFLSAQTSGSVFIRKMYSVEKELAEDQNVWLSWHNDAAGATRRINTIFSGLHPASSVPPLRSLPTVGAPCCRLLAQKFVLLEYMCWGHRAKPGLFFFFESAVWMGGSALCFKSYTWLCHFPPTTSTSTFSSLVFTFSCSPVGTFICHPPSWEL